jgi:ESCRT-II complex subunit VPS25
MPRLIFFLSIPEFHGLEKWLLLRALQTLQDQGKAELMNFDGNEGVKFF